MDKRARCVQLFVWLVLRVAKCPVEPRRIVKHRKSAEERAESLRRRRENSAAYMRRWRRHNLGRVGDG